MKRRRSDEDEAEDMALRSLLTFPNELVEPAPRARKRGEEWIDELRKMQREPYEE